MSQDVDLRRDTMMDTIGEAAASEAVVEPCVICLEQISEKAIAAPCEHSNFDFLCLASWLQERSTCSLCNSNVLSVKYNLESDSPKTYKPEPTTSNDRSDHERHNFGVRGAGLRRNQFRRRRQPLRNVLHTADEALLRRQHIYRHGLYSLHVGSNRLSHFQDLTPSSFSQDTELVSRSRKWIRRELQVFEFLRNNTTIPEGTVRKANNAEFLLEYIVAILKTVDMKGSGGQAEDLLQEFLGRENTRLFLHELQAWLRSPYASLTDWDRAVQYEDSNFRSNHLKSPSTTLAATDRIGKQSARAVRSQASARRLESAVHRYQPD